MRKIFTLLLLLSAGPALWALTPAERMKERLNSLRPFRVRFVQQVFVNGAKEMEESGDILFESGKRLKWSYTRPEVKIFVLTGNEYQFFQQEENQLQKGRITTRDEHLLWQILTDERLPSSVRCDEARRTVFLSTTSDQGAVQWEIHLDARFLPERVVQTDESGVTYTYLFSDYQGRVKCRDADFIIPLPKNVEIVEE